MLDVVGMPDHFKLEDDPFPKSKEGRIYRSRKYNLTLKLLYGWLSEGEMCALLGEPGSGKTTLMNDLTGYCERRGFTLVRVGNPSRWNLRPSGVYDAFALALGEHGVKFSRNNEVRYHELREYLGETAGDRKFALVVDEAHRLRGEFVKSCKEFSELTWTGRSDLLGVLFVGWASFLTSASRTAPDVYCRLKCKNKIIDSDRLIKDEVGAYLKWCTRRAGNANVFTDGALLALGVVGQVPLLAISKAWDAMAAAYAAGAEKVEAEHVTAGMTAKDIKEALGLSCADLGEAVGLHRGTVSNILSGTGTNSKDTADRLEKFMDDAIKAGGTDRLREKVGKFRNFPSATTGR